MKRIGMVIFSILLLAIPFLLLGAGQAGGFHPSDLRSLYDGNLFTSINDYIHQNLPLRQSVIELGLGVRAFGGQREYKQIFISGDELIPNIDPPMEYFVQENTAAILQFAETAGVPTYLMLIPSASAIRQQSLPRFTQTQVINQKQFIEEIYSEMAGKVTVADAYPILFNARDQYLYYRTENNLTSLGGYYLYSVLSGKLLAGMAGRSMSDFDIEYVPGEYYGDLYEKSPFKAARADTLSIFRYTRNPREYLVTHLQNGELKTYHTLYPMHLLNFDNKMDIYLGGISAMTEIRSSSPFRTNLLVLGDRTAASYVPFLANHYRTVTVVDLFQLDAAGYERLDLSDYAQVLFAYGMESYMHTNYPARAQRLLRNPDE